ncbi:PAS/PAC sensor hybrid histidine kinase (fragment) [Desulfamplus magnetovallimortis]|uniref:histidine kinase n=1 Tax=Desulfamplus magnetovallimortis TaxID=1246637 RepID=A0A1W1HHT6_9BACT
MENSTNLFYSHTVDHEITYISPQCREFLECEPEEAMVRWTDFATDSPVNQRGLELTDRTLKTGKRQPPYELELMGKKGKKITVEVREAPVFKDGQIVALVGSLTDITERKDADQRLRAILEANPDPVVVYDISGHPIYINPAFSEIFGWSLEELKGKKIPFVPEDQKELTSARIKEIFDSGKPVRFLTRRLTKKGAELDVNVSAAIIKGTDDQGTGMVVNLTDISEQMKIKNQLQQALNLESIGRLAGGVTHDFNNMLGVILGHTELAMAQVESDTSLSGNLEQIMRAASRSSELTKQLLAFARKQSALPRVIDLNETLSGMLKMLVRLIGEEIELLWIPGKDLWNVKIDTAQIDQILINLTINARDAIDGVGKVTIETQNVIIDEKYCKKHPDALSGKYIMIVLTDNGIGMDKETLSNVFEPFFTTKQSNEGTGLGLATVYGIVKQNRGFINVYSEQGFGTTFKIYLPMTQEVVKKENSQEIQHGIKGYETILVVEDEEAILNLSEDVLKQFGYNVLTADTPSEALRIIEKYEEPIHLLLSDVVLPEMNGKELREQIIRVKPDIKVLFMSGYTANVIFDRGILQNDVQLLQKPFSIHSLVSMVRQVLDE